MDEVAAEAPAIVYPSAPLPVVKVNITKVLNGYLVEPKDKHWNGQESVYLTLDGVIEEVRKNFS
jgi:hypothetical protein